MFRASLTMVALCVPFAAANAAEPTIRNLDIRGVRIGGATMLTIDGDDLGKSPRLLLPFAAKQVLRAGNTDKKAVFDVFTLKGDVEPGYYHLRVVAEGGVSLPIVIGVDELAQQTTVAAVTSLPAAVHGTLAGSATVEVKFAGKAKTRVLVEVEAQRLGSKLRPVVHLLSPRKLQLGWAWGTPAAFGDPRLEATLPDDGEYAVTLHDAEYAAPTPGFFRLKIGNWSYVDGVFPPAVARGQATSVEVLRQPMLAPMAIKAPLSLDPLRLAWPQAGTRSGPRPFVHVSPHPEFVETPMPLGKLQELPAGPVAVSGKLFTAFEEDRYQLTVTPLTKVRLEVFAERIGSLMDTALVVRNEKGDPLARAEDSPGTLDPILEYTVPAKVTSIVVGVVDAQGRGNPRGIYRLVAEPQGSIKDFKLTTPTPRITLPIGGRLVVPVHAERRGYMGKIDVSARLPGGIKLDGASIPEGADGVLVTLERSAATFDAVVTTLSGKGVDGFERSVAVKGHPLERLQPWLATEIAVAPSDSKAADFALDWSKLPTDAALVPGSKLVLPIKTVRLLDKTTVRLTLLTSQITPIVNNQPDPNKALRQEKPVEMPVKVADGEIVALVPVDLSAPVYDVTVQAELLDPAKKVLATAFAPVRRMAVRLPIVVKLDGPNRIEAPYDVKKGVTLKLTGKIERLPGVKADVAIALAGLPAGAKADAVTVKSDASDFVVNITLPPTVPPGEIKGVKLSGSFAPEPKTPAVRVKSRDVEVTLVLKAPAK